MMVLSRTALLCCFLLFHTEIKTDQHLTFFFHLTVWLCLFSPMFTHHSFPLVFFPPSRPILLSRPWLKQHTSACSAGWSIASTKLWTEPNGRVLLSLASWTLLVLRFSRFRLTTFSLKLLTTQFVQVLLEKGIDVFIVLLAFLPDYS